MRTWTGQHAWKEWSGRLAVATGDDFERALLPLLRLTWPELRQAPRLKEWDQRGIDLFVFADHGPFPCVVQCKGFKVQELGSEQIRDIEDSIQTFLDSDAVADTYLVIHNRDGRNRELDTRVRLLLDQVVKAGKANTADLWDRRRTVNEGFRRMEHLLELALRGRADAMSEHFGRLFRFAQCHVQTVPVSERSLRFRRGAPAEFGPLRAAIPRDPAEALEEASGTNWVILSGQFGAGKTTAALVAATGSSRPAVFVPCQEVPGGVFTAGSTNGLCRHIVETLALLDDIEESDRPPLTGMAAAVFSYLLREPKSRYLFILDGLDEHHVLARLSGLQRLSNQLAEFFGPVVLTTRREHLDSMVGDFNTAFSELGSKVGANRQATVLYLERWTSREVAIVIERGLDIVKADERARLDEFRQAVLSDSQPYGDLIYHPLFLQFILEDVVESGLLALGRPALIRRWVHRKIRRDREHWVPAPTAVRVQPVESMDTEEYIDRVCTGMASVAVAMSLEQEGRRELSESLPGERVAAIVGGAVDAGPLALLPILLNSLLTTLGPRQSKDIQVGFALRVLHEYFAAVHLVANGSSTSEWPASVRALVAELHETSVT
jgi:hypothetical protein